MIQDKLVRAENNLSHYHPHQQEREMSEVTQVNDNVNVNCPVIVHVQKYCANCSEPLTPSSQDDDLEIQIKVEEEEETTSTTTTGPTVRKSYENSEEVYELEITFDPHTAHPENLDLDVDDPITSFLQKNEINTETDNTSSSSSNHKNRDSRKRIKVQNILSSIYKLEYLNSLLNLTRPQHPNNNNNGNNNPKILLIIIIIM